MAKILAFLDGIKPIFAKIGALAKKLRQSIDEKAERIMTKSHRVERSARYWRKRLDELAQDVPGAHGPQRHEGDVTDQALLDRILHGIDPMSGTTIDAVTGKKHRKPRKATKINTPTDYVRLYDHIAGELRDELLDKARLARYGGEKIFKMEFPINDVFKGNVNQRMRGYAKVSRRKPQGVVPLDFEGGAILAFFRFRDDGTFGLYSMFPEPRT
ncbi:GDP-mannose 4,6-dehydratase [Oceanicola sp. D3]|uniref:GDP-mannose 4,6-dehydratase n=1 Tax=Oceanicola sp. D3 TaxID=2587163 RepID=UPI001121DD11|nr:GDP-mannose 4,6-dehydratase [Oceanicola sp. D3]QDC10935.1 GDP-mannose 4,6-dehydratase [Oceanicola sp. D3]